MRWVSLILFQRTSGGKFGRRTYPRHTAVDDKVGPVDEATLVAGQEENGLSLLDCFAEAAGREVDLAAVALGCVVAEPVLEEGGA